MVQTPMTEEVSEVDENRERRIDALADVLESEIGLSQERARGLAIRQLERLDG